MATKRLGRGLDALIPAAPAKENKEVNSPSTGESTGSETIVKINKIVPNKEQPRRHFDEDTLQELAENIKQHGVLVPLLVREKGDKYEILGGERRWRASQIAGIKELPVRILRGLSEKEYAEIALIDNIQRQDLNAVEEAQAYQRLIEEFHMKQDEVAERVSKSRVAITNSLRLLKLSDEVQQMLIEGLITAGHARAILGIEDKEKQTELAQQVVDEKLSVRDIEKIVKNMGKPSKPAKEKNVNESLEAVYKDIQEQLKARFNTKVVVSGKGDGSGKIEVEFYNHEDMERIMDIICKRQ